MSAGGVGGEDGLTEKEKQELEIAKALSLEQMALDQMRKNRGNQPDIGDKNFFFLENHSVMLQMELILIRIINE